MKTKINTHAITQEEYNQFFSEDITIRHRKGLAKKIIKRLNYFVQIFDTKYSSCDLDDSCTNLYYVFNTIRKQGPNKLFEMDEEVFTVYIEDDDSVNPCNILVSWLWDDKAVQKILDEIKEANKNAEQKDNQFERNKKNILEKIRSILTEGEKDFLKASCGIVAEL